MKEQGFNLAYIGTPDSFFTRCFLPELRLSKHNSLKFICVIQDEFFPVPSNPSILLRILLFFKKSIQKIQRLSSLFYWSVYCQQNNIRLKTTNVVNSIDIATELSDCDFVLSAGIRSKFNRSVYTASKNGMVNFHYSLLPKYRGTNALLWQKVNNDDSYGYTFHKMNENLDSGDILLQVKININQNTAANNSGKSIPAICDLLTLQASSQLYKLLSQSLPLIRQSNEEVSSFTNEDYLNYININTYDSGSVWSVKCRNTNFFILNKKWIVNLESRASSSKTNQLLLNGMFSKDGYSFAFKKINYLPAIFYYFALRKYFG